MKRSGLCWAKPRSSSLSAEDKRCNGSQSLSGDVEMTPAPSATVAADEPPVRAVVPFTACLELFSAPEALEGLALGGPGL
jgi:hypothetical protein